MARVKSDGEKLKEARLDLKVVEMNLAGTSKVYTKDVRASWERKRDNLKKKIATLQKGKFL